MNEIQPETDSTRAAREAFVDKMRAKGLVTDERVLAAIAKVPRHLFLAQDLAPLAYHDTTVTAGQGQTTTKPSCVAYCCQCLHLRGNERVLEIGTGSGYPTAVLAELCREVFTIERYSELGERALSRLRAAGYGRVMYKTGDGSAGWAEHAPFDCIMVGAAAPSIPEPLLEQLVEGGRIVIPVGSRASQTIDVYVKKGSGCVKEFTVRGEVFYVPLIGQFGWEEIL